MTNWSGAGGPGNWQAPTGQWQPPAGNWQQPGWPGQQPPPPYGGAPQQWAPGPYGPPPRSRMPWVFGGIAAAVVIVVAAVVAVIALSSGGVGKPDSAGDTVKAYLEALARGDADAALSYAADTPADKTYLSDEVLKKQIEHWPITDIRILSDDGVGALGRVHVAVNFGDQTSDVTMNVDKVDGQWKLKEGAIKLTFSSGLDEQAMETLTMFGKPLAVTKPTYVFPGWIDIGNTNPNLTQEVRGLPLLLDEISGYGSGVSMSFSFTMSESGRTAVEDALKSAIDQCAKSTQLQPTNCPQGIRDSGLVDGTARWSWPQTIKDLSISNYLGPDLQVRVNGSAEFQLTAQATSGGPRSGTVTGYITGKADLTKNPPVITMQG